MDFVKEKSSEEKFFLSTWEKFIEDVWGHILDYERNLVLRAFKKIKGWTLEKYKTIKIKIKI